jgi:hypothetical protein
MTSTAAIRPFAGCKIKPLHKRSCLRRGGLLLFRRAYRCPPDAEMRSPVSQDDWSEAKNSATRAMSSG